MTQSVNEYVLRTFVPGDEANIVKLFNTENAGLAGFVPRTVEYWRWSCLERPDVTDKGILVVESGNAIIGYIVVGNTGTVWETCYDSKLDGKLIATKLLDWAIGYAKAGDCDSLELNANVNDKVLQEVCAKLDFSTSLSELTYLSVLDLPGLICKILESKKQGFKSSQLFWFNLKHNPSWTPNFGIKVSANEISVVDKVSGDQRVVIDIDMPALVDLIFGREKISNLILSSKVRFSFLSFVPAYRFLSLLKTKAPWYIPKSDVA